ncbi:MAG TPA: AAA family ATPase [Vicinamibacterales bacterium]|nr:AAA family ATPase [Vicinamibacterales bacterium]
MEARLDLVNDLESYVSPTHRRFLRRLAGAPPAPDAERFEVVALLADISGFSTLTATLAAEGAGGAETLSSILNDRFGRLVDLVHQHGGEVQDFAGDAAIAYWIVDEIPHAARRAAACGLAIRDLIQGPVAPGISLRLRVGVGAGHMLSTLVGGSQERWLTLMAGNARTEMLRADAAALPGQVVLAPSVLALIDVPVRGDRLAGGCLRVEAIEQADAAIGTGPDPTPAAPAALRGGVPRAVQKRIDAGQRLWLGEFATVTALFVNAPDLRYDDLAQLPALQRVTLTMQSAVHRFGGSVNRLLADDKGTVLIAAWGIPLHTHEDDPVRAALAALEMRDALRHLGIRPAMGISTGRAFAGAVGNDRRRQYALLGDSINLAARLMQEAADSVLCDGATRSAAHARVRFGASTARQLKGQLEPVPVSAALVPRERGSSHDIISRTAEQRTLTDALRSLDEGGQPGLLVLQGEPGIGKSALVSVFLRRAQASHVRVLVGASESIDQTSPYRAWRAVFDALLGLDAQDAAEARLAVATRTLADDAAIRYLPLVSDVLGLGLQPSDLTAGLTPNARTEAAREVLLRLFHLACGEARVALVLEDAHWMDSSSWSLALALHRTCPRLLLLLVLRPMSADETSDDCRRLLGDAGARTIDLGVLSDDDALALACRRLDVDELPEAVARLVRERGEGHPLFTEQLVRALVERGVVRVTNHECQLAPDVPMPELPETVQGLVRGRIDLLGAEDQLTLRMASVLGRGIDLDVMCALHAVHDRAAIEAQLARMAALDLLEHADSAQGAQYAFKHAIIRDVAYSTLALAHRRSLHRAAAECYERRASDAAPMHALLARHWSEAGVADKALHYLDLAGADAFHTGNYRETLTLMTEALALGDRAPEHRPPRRHAVWLRRAGQASYALGRVADTLGYMEQAAAVLGRPIPSTTVSRVAAMAAASLRLWARRLTTHRMDPVSEQGATVLETATILDAAAYPYYLHNDTFGMLYCLIARLDEADRLTPTPALVTASAAVAYVWSYAGFFGKADRLTDWALSTAQALERPHEVAMVHYAAAVVDVGRGRWTEAAAHALESARIYRGLGEHLLARDSDLMWPYLKSFTGSWDESESRYALLRTESRNHENWRQLGWACIGLAKVHYRRGRLGDAADAIAEGMDAVAQGGGDRVSELMLGALRACVRVRTGDRAGALADIELVGRAFDPRAVPSAFMQTDAYGFLAEACMALLKDGAEPAARLQAARACAGLRRAMRVFPAAKPPYLLWSGLFARARGRQAEARRRLTRALTAAEALALDFERHHAADQLNQPA